MEDSPFDYTPGFRRQLRVLPSRLGGMGVFCDTPIKSGELIELSTVTLLSEQQILQYESRQNKIDKKVNVRHYLFGMGKCYAIPHGFGCFYNHAPSENGPLDRNHVTSNTSFSVDDDLKLIAFIAKKDIQPKNEVLIDFFREYALEYEQSIKAFNRTYGGISREDGVMAPVPSYRWSAEQKQRALPYESSDSYRDLELEEIVAQIESIKTPGLLDKLQKRFSSLRKKQVPTPIAQR